MTIFSDSDALLMLHESMIGSASLRYLRRPPALPKGDELAVIERSPLSYTYEVISYASPLIMILSAGTGGLAAAVLGTWHKVLKLRRDIANTSTEVKLEQTKRMYLDLVQDQLRSAQSPDFATGQAVEPVRDMLSGAADALMRMETLSIEETKPS